MIVVGAGPAGLTAATGLAAERLAVLVLEEHDQVGDPVHCTGVLGLDAFPEFDLPRDTICTITSTARFHGRDGRSVRIEGGEVAAAVVDRGRFDRSLADRAADAGAVIARGARVQGIRVAPDAVTVWVRFAEGHRAISGRVCVLACGAQYRFNRQLGLGIPRAYLQTAQLETEFPGIPDVEIDLDRALAPRGFAWIVPFRRDQSTLARVGVMTSDSAAVPVSAATTR